MAELVTIIALIVAIRFSFRPAFVPEGHREIAGASGGSLAEVFRFFRLENALDLVYGFVTRF